MKKQSESTMNALYEKYGRAFIESLTDQEVRFVIMHGTMHDLHRMANMATDYCINQKLIDDGPIDLPRTGMSVKQIWDLLEPPEGGGGDGEGGGELDNMKKQRKSTTLRGAEPGTGKSNTIKGIQATPYIDLEDNMKKQSASEKKLFAKLEGLIAKVGYMDEHLTAAQKNVARINARLDVLESTTPPAKPKPEDYVLTDADWQRVIKEQWLCEFETASGTSRSIGTLEEIRAGDYCHHAHGYFTKCRPLNRPGVLQPYFGQGMPVKAGTKVLMKQRCGLCSIGKALAQDWNNINCGSDIVAFMVLEQ